MTKKIAVIGGGAAGMMAACQAARNGAVVTLFERNEKLGKKLFITGKGRCNVCSATPLPEWFDKVPRNPKFLYSAVYSFDSAALMAFLEKEGVSLKVERGERVFPVSDKSSDILRAFSSALKKVGVTICLNTKVDGLWTEKEKDDLVLRGVQIKGERLPFDAVIIATGGVSYPKTGSTGDGYRLAESCGHSVVGVQASLIPMNVDEAWAVACTGLSLRNVTLRVYQRNKLRFEELGEMLFSHFGVTGPLVLSGSAYCVGDCDVRLEIDLKPGLDIKQLEQRLQRDFDQNARRAFKNSLDGLLPQKLISVIVEKSGIDPQRQACEIRKNERQELARLLKALPLTVTGFRPIEEAIVTRGGIPTKQVDPSTMQSRLLPGLYFAGEMLDVDAQTGGYNLQIAFSTGHLAGQAAAESQ